MLNAVAVFLIVPLLGIHPIQKMGIKTLPTDISGKWYLPEKNAAVEIYQKDQLYYGKIIWVNPEKAESEEKSKKILGKEILSHLALDSDNHYHNGEVYAIRRDEYYACSAQLNNQQLKLEVEVGWFTKEMVWTRVPEGVNLVP